MLSINTDFFKYVKDQYTLFSTNVCLPLGTKFFISSSFKEKYLITISLHSFIVCIFYPQIILKLEA